MGRLFVLFFLMPWWAYIPASVGVLWLGERAYEQALETEAEKTAALETAAPEPIDIGSFDRERDIHTAREVNVVGLIDHDLDYELVERTNGVVTKTRYLYMLFGTEEYGSTVVRGALMLDKGDEAAFLDSKADEWAVDATADYWVYALNGFAARSTTLSGMADDAIAEQGLTKAEDFIFIEPFFEGREVALTANGVPDQTRQIFWAIAAVIAAIGVLKRVKSVFSRPSQDDPDAVDLASSDYGQPEPEPQPEIYAATAAAYALPEDEGYDAPLDRAARRADDGPWAARDESELYTGYADPDLDDYAQEMEDDVYAADPAQAHAFQSEGGQTDGFQTGAGAVQETRQKSSASAFYAKLALGMLLVGTLAYDPSFLSVGLPLAGVALFWFGVYIVFRRLRNGARKLVGGAARAPQHSRRPDGVGGGDIDLGGPVSGGRRERGVI